MGDLCDRADGVAAVIGAILEHCRGTPNERRRPAHPRPYPQAAASRAEQPQGRGRGRYRQAAALAGGRKELAS